MPNLEIVWTKVDEAPALATYSLLPIVEAFVGAAGVSMKLKDISLAGRIIANFPDKLKPAQRAGDELAELGALATRPEANIIKLPNISASIPQLKAAIKELQDKGFDIPDYPDSPTTDAEKDIKARYAKVLGSAVNPVLREGNSDRRAAGAVKQYARNNPHKMGAWSRDSKSHVAHMSSGDYYGSEVSTTVAQATNARIELVGKDGAVTVLKAKTPIAAGEIIDAAVMSKKALRAFYAQEIEDAKKQGVLFSLHLKATMMKISDPIMFGHAVSVFFADVLAKHAATLKKLDVNLNNGFGDLLTKIEILPDAEKSGHQGRHRRDLRQAARRRHGQFRQGDHQPQRAERRDHRRVDAGDDPRIRQDVGRRRQAARRQGRDPGPRLCDDLSGGDRRLQGARRLRSQDHGVGPNVGLMAQKAEEYGSHDKTFEIPSDGSVRVVSDDGKVLLERPVETRRHLPHVRGPRRPGPGLGQARGSAGAALQHAGRVLARPQARP